MNSNVEKTLIVLATVSVKTNSNIRQNPDIILDGGNVVDNVTETRVIVTDRIRRNNPSLTKLTAKETLKCLFDVNEVAIISEPPGDTTGHANGLGMWPTDPKIFLIQTDELTHNESIDELKSSYPGVEIIVVPIYIPNTTWKNFTSAHNCFVNSIVANKYIYMPTFNDIQDDEMFELFKSYTDKTIVKIPAENVVMMGGCVRCLTWQIKKFE